MDNTHAVVKWEGISGVLFPESWVPQVTSNMAVGDPFQ